MEQSTLGDYKKYFSTCRNDIILDYFTFLKFKSISSESEHAEELLKCVQWLKENIESLGFITELWETSGHPILFAENTLAGPNKPTILIYNHYDVQPADPLELWDHPPFEPLLKDDDIVYARGAQDNKGQCMYVFQALKAIKSLYGKFPVNIKWIIEGEEEVGSKSLSSLLEFKKEQLKSDYLAIVDLNIPSAETPSVTLGIRGIVTMEIEVIGSTTDLHSGTHGGRAFNPIHALIEILSHLRDLEGNIAIPGFYDDVIELSPEDRKQISFEFDEEDYFKNFGIISSGGEIKYPPLERSTIRPTIEINGIKGGYTGPGFKTVIPAKAYAKLSSRLVPNQDPVKVAQSIENFIKEKQPKGIDVNVKVHPGKGTAVRASLNSKVVQAFAQAFTEIFNQPCKFGFEGGSIPIVAELQNVCEGEVVLLGTGLDSDQIHAPNEHFSMQRFEKGFLVMVRALEILGNIS